MKTFGGKYILDENGNPKEEPDLMVWAKWMENGFFDKRKIAQDTIDGVLVSTVFLGLDYSFDDGPPVLYETMVFKKGGSDEMQRYHTKEEALEGHKEMVELVKEELSL